VRLESAHAVVLAGRPGEGSTEVLLPALAPAASAEPIAAPHVLLAARCEISAGCGSVAAGAPLQTYQGAAVAPDGAHLAVVVEDALTSASHLQVIDTVSDALLADIAGGARPSWSPDGAQLALATATAVEVFDVRSATLSIVASDTGLTGPPLWLGSTTLVLSTATASGTAATVELVNRALDARYELPGVPPSSTAVAVSPGGSRLAVATTDGGLIVMSAAGAVGGAERLTGRLQALGFAGEGTLVAVNDSADSAQLVRISVVGGDSTSVSLGAGITDLQSVRVALDGRRLVCLAVDFAGVRQAYVADADGSGELALTRFVVGGLQAQAVDFSD
jgi:hypothetical protein